MRCEVLIEGQAYQIELARSGDGFSCTVDGEPVVLDVATTARDVLSILHESRSYEAGREQLPTGETFIVIDSERFRVVVRDPRSLRDRGGALRAEAGRLGIHAPMPGKVVRLLAAQGDRVEAGQPLLVVEAMKMQNEIRATKKGTLVNIAVQEASSVNAGDLLVELE